MFDYSQLLGNSGLGRYYLDHKGRRWRFDYQSDTHRAAFEQRLKQIRMQGILGDRDIPDDDRIKLIDRLRQDIDAGLYRYGSPRCWDFIRTPRGAVVFFQSLLLPNHPNVREKDVEMLMIERPTEIEAIQLLIFADTESLVKRAAGGEREGDSVLGEVYHKLTLPGDYGGMNMSIEQIAQLTDRQKDIIIANIGEAKDMASRPTGVEPVKLAGMVEAIANAFHQAA